jgi:DNA-directed RNA polymerase specialized sigma24 family protein
MGANSGQQPQDDVRTLERLLDTMRHNSAQADLVKILERRLETVRQDQEKLIWHLAREQGKAMHMLAARLVGRNDADDVTQEAFVSLLKWVQSKPLSEIMHLLRSPKGLQRLMYRQTVCRAYDHLRRQSCKEGKWVMGDEIEGDGKHFLADPVSTLDQHISIEIERLDRAYASLPPAQRIAHILHYYYGFTDADFEATLGLNKSSSRSLVHRANLALKRAMEMKQ